MREVWIQAQRMRAVKRRSELLADGEGGETSEQEMSRGGTQGG